MHEEHVKKANINFLEGKTCDSCVWHFFILDHQEKEFIAKYCRFKSPRKLSAGKEELDTYQKCPPEETCQFWKSMKEFLDKYNNEQKELWQKHGQMWPLYNNDNVEHFHINTLRDKIKELDL